MHTVIGPHVSRFDVCDDPSSNTGLLFEGQRFGYDDPQVGGDRLS